MNSFQCGMWYDRDMIQMLRGSIYIFSEMGRCVRFPGDRNILTRLPFSPLCWYPPCQEYQSHRTYSNSTPNRKGFWKMDSERLMQVSGLLLAFVFWFFWGGFVLFFWHAFLPVFWIPGSGANIHLVDEAQNPRIILESFLPLTLTMNLLASPLGFTPNICPQSPVLLFPLPLPGAKPPSAVT